VSHYDNGLEAQLCAGVLPVTPCPQSTCTAKFGLQANSARCAEGGAVRRHARWG